MNIRPYILIALSILALPLAGCGPSRDEIKARRAVDDYYFGDYGRAAHALRSLAQNVKDENFVLNNARLGSVALAAYVLDEAESAFLNAYDVMNATGTNDGGRGLAAAVLREKLKVWKGEPFEKAMVSFYLGLVYYISHDYDNARAAFENSLFKLRDYGQSKDQDDQYRAVESDFVIGYLMLARAFLQSGEEDKARKAFDRVARLRPDLRPLADFEQHRRANVLLVVDYGIGPRRATNSMDNSFVAFRPTPRQVGPIPMPVVLVDGRPIAGPRTSQPALPTIDLLELAQDKRWQSIDTIRLVKSMTGNVLIAAGGVEAYRASQSRGSAQRRDATAAAALLAAGILLKASSEADLRTWEMLPRTTFVIPLTLPPGRHDITIEFPDSRRLTQTWRGIIAPEKADATYYVRIQPNPTGPYTWPPPSLANPPQSQTP